MCDPNDVQLSLLLQQQHVGAPNVQMPTAQSVIVGGGGPGLLAISTIGSYAVAGVQPVPVAGNIPMTPEDVSRENFWLREKLKEITSDRDKLLCEVANLRFELDMAELKRLPEDRLVYFYLCC